MKKTLLIYSSTDNHTKNICKYMASIIEKKSNTIVTSINNLKNSNLIEFDMIIIGASIRYGKHKPEVYDFIERNISVLNNTKTAFFSVNVVARKPDKNNPNNNPYIRKFLTLTSWRPDYLEVFPGRIIYSKYKLTDKLMIRFIMWLTNGPTDTSQIHEFTDWSKIRDFTNTLMK